MTDSFLPFQKGVEPGPVNHDAWTNGEDWRPAQFHDRLADSEIGFRVLGSKLAQPAANEFLANSPTVNEFLANSPTEKWRQWESTIGGAGQELNFVHPASPEADELTLQAFTAGANWREGCWVGAATIGADYAGMRGAQALGCDRNSMTYRFFQPKGYDTGLAFGGYLSARALGASAPLALGAALGGWAIGHASCLSEFRRLVQPGSWF